MIISSQRYLDEDIVAEKIAAQDFVVHVSPAFEVDGDIYQVVLDGHHSLAAALESGVSPVYHEMGRQEHDAVGLIAKGEVDDFLAVTRIDSDYYSVETGVDVW